MYTIELTRGLGWDAPVLEVHGVKQAKHVVDVERMAQSLLNGVGRTSTYQQCATNYRVLDHLGRCVRSSADIKRPFSWRSARTFWG